MTYVVVAYIVMADAAILNLVNGHRPLYVVMACAVMACVVMADSHRRTSNGLNSYGRLAVAPWLILIVSHFFTIIVAIHNTYIQSRCSV